MLGIEYIREMRAKLATLKLKKILERPDFSFAVYQEKLKRLVKSGADLNVELNDGKTPLVSFIRNFELVNFLVENGANIEKESDRGTISPLLHALYNLYSEKRYIQNPSYGSRNQRTIIMESGKIYNPMQEVENLTKVVFKLLNSGADVSAVEPSENNALHLATNYHLGKEIIESILEKGGKEVLTHQNRDGQTPLFFIHDKTVAELFFKWIKKSDNEKKSLKKELVNHQDNHGKNPARFAIERGREEVVRLFLSINGFDVFQKDKHGNSLLHNAYRTLNLIPELINLGLDVNEQNNNGDTPLHIAVMKRSESGVKEFLRNGANPLIKNKDGLTSYELVLRGIEVEKIKGVVYISQSLKNIFTALFKAVKDQLNPETGSSVEKGAETPILASIQKEPNQKGMGQSR